MASPWAQWLARVHAEKVSAPDRAVFGASMKILIVDDDFTSRRILMKCVKSLGECDLAANGKEAMLAYETAWSEQEPYDLILLDIMMPEMDGNEVLRNIRAREKENVKRKIKTTSIAMATSLGDNRSVIGSFREQCDGYIVKPYSTESILRDLRRAGIVSGP
jgi:two-component system, chemotaxis family, chemotaxis protein CheY